MLAVKSLNGVVGGMMMMMMGGAVSFVVRGRERGGDVKVKHVNRSQAGDSISLSGGAAAGRVLEVRPSLCPYCSLNQVAGAAFRRT